MEFKYGLEDRPPLWETLLFGLQWFAVAVPVIVVIGRIISGLHDGLPGEQTLYLQKMTFIIAAALACQIGWGHRLPIITGPSSILLIGVMASRAFDAHTVYTAIVCGGIILTFLSITGLFGALQQLFTTRIIAVILMLIAFTLAPKIMDMITVGDGGISPVINLSFALFLTLLMFWLNGSLSGIWKSTLIIWVMFLGSLFYVMAFNSGAAMGNTANAPLVSFFFTNLTTRPSFDPGVLISFIVCFVALSINDLGSIQSVNALLKPPDARKRLIRGMMVTGLANAASGFLGVLGPVNYSLSPGVLAATGCASRWTMIPAVFLLLLLSFSPLALSIVSGVPSVVVGSVLIYILASQIAAGLTVALETRDSFGLQEGIIIGAPLLLGTVIAFMPIAVFLTIPPTLQPIVGNGFVVGMTAALMLEHVIFRAKKVENP